MAWKQLHNPNLDPEVYEGGKLLNDWYGWCLATVGTAFGLTGNFPTAWAAWEGTDASLKHEDRNFPVGVYFPIWFSGYEGMGHVAFAYVNASGQMNIWTSPYVHTPYFFTDYHTVDELASGYHVTYVGWSEGIGTDRVIEAEPDQQPASASYEVKRTLAGYKTSNDAANHINQAVDVPARLYSIFNQANGMINVTTDPAIAGAWINPADNTDPEPPAPAKPANITFTKLDKPLNLIANKQPTHIWDLGFDNDTEATSVATLDQGASFTAVGRAQRTDGDRPAYFMDADSFGEADTTGIPAKNQGINTVDLSPAPASQQIKVTVVDSPDTVNIPAPITGTDAVASSLKIVDNSGAPDTTETPAAPVPQVAPADEKLPDGVSLYTKFMNPVYYAINPTKDGLPLKIVDLQTGNELDVPVDTKVNVGAKFIYKGAWFYRSVSSIDKSTFYAFPVTALRKLSSAESAEPIDAELDKLFNEAETIVEDVKKASHPHALPAAATSVGVVDRILNKLHLGK